MRNTKPNQTGASLVSALLVLALITAIAIGLSVVIMNQVNTTRDINFAVSSYYAADSSLDQGLWTIKQARWDGLTIDQTLAKLGTVAAPQNGSLTDTRAKWKRTAVTLNETVKFDLGTEQSATVELYNPPPAPQDYANAPQYIEVTWVDPVGTAKVQVSWLGWNATTGFDDESNGQFYPYTNGARVNIVDASLPVRIYLRIKAKDSGVNNLTVKSYDGSQNLIDIPSQIRLTVTGEFPGGSITSKQALGASVPWLVPISGLYSYVLYSNDSLDKN